MPDNPLVSICCITYNHKPFISRAIEGMISQRTEFPFEILIYDDASVDGTDKIIREYAEKHPDKIFPIINIENQYSKGAYVNYQYNYLRAKGKYIAICEGDDYWSDIYKLSKQVLYMENNDNCTITFHNASVIDISGRHLFYFLSPDRNTFNRYSGGAKVYTPTEGIELGFVPTASLVMRRDAILPPEDYYFNNVCGDLPLCLMCYSKGYGYYFDEVMSAYRRGNPESASGSVVKSNDRIDQYIEGVIAIYQKFNERTDYVFSNSCDYRIRAKKFERLLLKTDFHGMKSGEYSEFYVRVRFITKLSLLIRSRLPGCFRALQKWLRF